jgi:hypothetical protein
MKWWVKATAYVKSMVTDMNLRFAIGFGCFLLGSSLLLLNHSKQKNIESKNPETSEQPLGVDTMIPLNHVLVPIDVENANALEGILGEFGVVDIYVSQHESGKKRKKIIEAVKLIRAPLNPNQFAVLIHESQMQGFIASSTGPLFVVVQKPTAKVRGVVEQKEKKYSPNVEYFSLQRNGR